jgi:hypothetical protein
LIAEAHTILSTTTLPQGRAEAALEKLVASLKLADLLLETPPAVALGKRGGLKTAERGPEYYAKIAGMRKTRAGGRKPNLN